ncbi:GNAT family N-acetyltransferase [Actinoplanes sp. NPDC049599]|uniref:GNAT family N-acetyltransferase n=1 Tax=Actinoplanes sp. NPDC049599 TaxID=3363903 RepID=UPI0037957992
MGPEPKQHPAEVPPGYPREFERELRLSDGRAIWLRPLVPDDSEQLAHAIRTADPETVYRRFLGAAPRVTPALLEHLCTVDYRKRFALVAADAATGVGVGIARYEAVTADSAEVAVAVDPAWRRAGLATALVEMLAEAALGRGITSFSASYLAENRPVRALLGLAGDGKQAIHAGLAEAAVALDRASVTAAVQRLTRDGAPGAAQGPAAPGP